MTRTTQTPYFEGKFENIEIHVHRLEIEQWGSVTDGVLFDETPYSGIWLDMDVVGLPTNKNIVGRLFIILKSKSETDGSALFLEGNYMIKAANDTESADTFCKLIQFMFGWTTKYVDENNIVGKDGSKFIVPEFPYSKKDFIGSFPG